MNNKIIADDEVLLSIAIDTEWDRHVSIPFKPVQLPHWKECATVAPCVRVKLVHLQEVITAYKAKNIHRVNEILSAYY